MPAVTKRSLLRSVVFIVENQLEPPRTAIKPEVTRERRLPWWFVYFAWILVIAVSLTTGFFTILYGLSFGKQKQEKWLLALFVSIFQDVLISQPLKIFAISVFIAFIIRKPNPVEINEQHQQLIDDDHWVQEEMDKVRIICASVRSSVRLFVSACLSACLPTSYQPTHLSTGSSHRSIHGSSAICQNISSASVTHLMS